MSANPLDIRRSILVALACGASCLTVTPACADDPMSNVQALYQACTERLGEFGSGYCGGFITAVGQALGSAGVVCFNSATEGAGRQAFINWAEKHPDKWSEARILGVESALMAAWPCRR